MPDNWEWWAGIEGSKEYDVGYGATREECIRDALRNCVQGERFEIIEAVQSNAQKYQYFDIVPFTKTRNREVITAGVQS